MECWYHVWLWAYRNKVMPMILDVIGAFVMYRLKNLQWKVFNSFRLGDSFICQQTRSFVSCNILSTILNNVSTIWGPSIWTTTLDQISRHTELWYFSLQTSIVPIHFADKIFMIFCSWFHFYSNYTYSIGNLSNYKFHLTSISYLVIVFY